jgi:hypothetical protein
MGQSRRRQRQLHRPIQVVGDATPQSPFDLLPIAARRGGPAQPTLDDRDARLDCPPLAISLPGQGPLELAATGPPRPATGWPPCDRWNAALEAEVFSPPAVVGLRIVAPVGQQVREAQAGQGLCCQGAQRDMSPARPALGHLPSQHQSSGPDRDRPCQPGAGAVACPGPAVDTRGWPGPVQPLWKPQPRCGTVGTSRANQRTLSVSTRPSRRGLTW